MAVVLGSFGLMPPYDDHDDHDGSLISGSRVPELFKRSSFSLSVPPNEVCTCMAAAMCAKMVICNLNVSAIYEVFVHVWSGLCANILGRVFLFYFTNTNIQMRIREL